MERTLGLQDGIPIGNGEMVACERRGPAGGIKMAGNGDFTALTNTIRALIGITIHGMFGMTNGEILILEVSRFESRSFVKYAH